MKFPRRNRRAAHARALFATGLLLPFVCSHPASAQAPAAPGAGAGSAAGGPGSAAPGVNAPAPGVSAGQPSAARIAPGQPLTLADVVRLSVGDNSGLALARQRLQQAQELINQVNAQDKPRISADANDTYSSYPAFAPTLPALSVANPTLPGGGTIPSVIDQADQFSTAFIGGGGVGVGSTSVTSPGLGTGTTNATGTTGVTGATGGTPSVGGTSPVGSGAGAATPGTASPGVGAPSPAAPAPPTPGAPGTGTATPGTGGASPGTTAPGNGGTGGANTGDPAGGATGTALYSVPPIVLGYVADMSTLTKPPLAALAPPQPTPPAPAPDSDAEPHDTARADAEPRQPGDTGTTGTGGTGTAGGVGTAGGTTSAGQRNTYAARVAASQYIDLFGLIPAARDAQNDVRDFYALDITRLQNETALAAKDLFFNVLFGEEEVATEQEQVRFALENVRITQDRFEQGIVAQFDVLTAQTALATAQQQLIAAEDVYDLAQTNLGYLLGTDPDQPLNLVPPPLPALDTAIDVPQSTRLALRQRPEVSQAARNVNEAQRLVRIAGETLLPTFGVVGNLQHDSVASITEPKDFATISAELDLPIDDAGATRSRVRSARITVQSQIITQSQLQLSVSLEVRQAAINVRNGQAQVATAETAVTQARAAVVLANDQYQAGIGTFLNVLNALAQLATARLNLANGEYFYQTSLAQLVRDIGGR